MTMTAGDRPTRAERYAAFKGLRDEGLTLAEIGARFGLSANMVSDVLNDPDRSKTKARRLRYQQPCPKCGRMMDGSNGRASVPRRCADCMAEELHAEKFWTRARVIAAIKGWAAEFGSPPRSHPDWTRAGVTPGGVRHPSCTSVYRGQGTPRAPRAPFASWADAVEAAGFPRPHVGTYERTDEIRERMSGAQRARYAAMTPDEREALAARNKTLARATYGFARDYGDLQQFVVNIGAQQRADLNALGGPVGEHIRRAIDRYLAEVTA